MGKNKKNSLRGFMFIYRRNYLSVKHFESGQRSVYLTTKLFNVSLCQAGGKI